MYNSYIVHLLDKQIINKMNKYENESGYDSESSAADGKPTIHHCPYCKKGLCGPRIGLVVHLGSVHTDKALLEVSKHLKGSEVHNMLSVRKRTIHRILSSDRT